MEWIFFPENNIRRILMLFSFSLVWWGHMVLSCVVPLQHHFTHAKSLQSCPALCDPMDYSPPRFSIHGILQAKILEWVAMSSSRLWRGRLDWVINIFKVLWLKICNFVFGTITGFIVILFFLKKYIGVEFSWILCLLQTHALSSLWNTWIFIVFF